MDASPSRWSRLRRHAVFPLLVYLALSQIFRDNFFPFTHYPMYSKPTGRPLKFQFLAGADGKPLAVNWLTGITPSQVGKLHGDRKLKFPTEQEAAQDVLRFLRTQNARRKNRPMPPRIQLVETAIGFEGSRFVETNRVLAEHSSL